MWLDKEEENQVVFLLLSCYTWKRREWLALLFALLVVPILAHTCCVCTFSCLSRERTIHYTIVLIPTVFYPYMLVSNCYLVMIFFIPIICEKFKFTSDTHSWSFANKSYFANFAHSCRIFILLLSRKNQAQIKNLHDSSFPQQELARMSNFLHSSSFRSRFGTVGLGH